LPLICFTTDPSRTTQYDFKTSAAGCADRVRPMRWMSGRPPMLDRLSPRPPSTEARRRRPLFSLRAAVQRHPQHVVVPKCRSFCRFRLSALTFTVTLLSASAGTEDCLSAIRLERPPARRALPGAFGKRERDNAFLMRNGCRGLSDIGQFACYASTVTSGRLFRHFYGPCAST
jgi:hypothetical protein